jgi:opacity protein-like surface antigen
MITPSRVLPALAAAALVLAGGRPAAAIDWAIGAEGGYNDLTNAPKSAKAIFNRTTGGGTIGGFVRLGLGQSFFLEAHGRQFERTGERVFVADAGGEVFRLGHPLTIRLIPVYGAIGYRFLPNSHFAPYVTVGLGATAYKETSDVAGLIETQSTTKVSGHGALGLDYLAGPLRLGVEVGYSTVPNTIASQGYRRSTARRTWAG